MLCVVHIEYIYLYIYFMCLVVESSGGKNIKTESHSHLNKAYAADAKVTRA